MNWDTYLLQIVTLFGIVALIAAFNVESSGTWILLIITTLFLYCIVPAMESKEEKKQREKK